MRSLPVGGVDCLHWSDCLWELDEPARVIAPRVSPRGVQTPVMSYTCASRMIFGHQKLLTGWVHSGWGVFSTKLKLSIRSRSITAVHLALKSHMNAIRRSQRHAMLLLTGGTLSASRKPPLICTAFPVVVLMVLVLGMFINA